MTIHDAGKTSATLRAMGVPTDKIPAKTRSIDDGLRVALLGLVFLLLGAGLVLVPMLVLGQIPGIPFLLFAGLFVLGGLFVVFVGGHVVSAEGARAAGGLFRALAKSASLIRRGGRA
jgi:hypothetical protein